LKRKRTKKKKEKQRDGETDASRTQGERCKKSGLKRERKEVAQSSLETNTQQSCLSVLVLVLLSSHFACPWSLLLLPCQFRGLTHGRSRRHRCRQSTYRDKEGRQEDRQTDRRTPSFEFIYALSLVLNIGGWRDGRGIKGTGLSIREKSMNAQSVGVVQPITSRIHD